MAKARMVKKKAGRKVIGKGRLVRKKPKLKKIKKRNTRFKIFV